MPTSRARIRRGFLATLVAIGLTVVPVSMVLACSCMQATITESAGFADVVFTGTTTAVEAPEPGAVVSSMDPVHYAFAVDKVFKGDLVEAEIVATTAMDGASCGTSFGMDERWLVFANFQDGDVWTGLCSGNVLLADEETEAAALAELGEPIAEPEGAPTEGDGEGAGFDLPLPIILGLVGVVVVLGASAWAFVIEPRRRVS
jgi:hypothetical protein